MIVSLPYSAFYIVWEQTERRAAEMYPRYVGGPMDHVAQTHLEAVHAFRSASAGEDLKRWPEKTAQKARKAWEKINKARSRKPPAASTEPSKPRKASKKRRSASKKAAKRQGAKKR